MVDSFKHSSWWAVHNASSVPTISVTHVQQIQCSREPSIRFNLREHSTLPHSKCFSFPFISVLLQFNLRDKASVKLCFRKGNISPTIIYKQTNKSTSIFITYFILILRVTLTITRIKVKVKITQEQANENKEVELYSFFKLGARWECVVNATPRPLYVLERPGTHRIGVWVGPRVVLDGYRKSRPHRDSIPGTSSK